MFWIVFVMLVISYFFLDWLLRSLKVGNFHDKYVFITGCDSGFGKELAIRLDNLGFNVFAGRLTEEGAKFLSHNRSSRLVTIIVDVTKTESIDAALKFVKQRVPMEKGLWAVVNNAGIAGNVCKVEMCTKQDFIKVLDVNLLGQVEVTRLFLPLLRKAKGRIVNMSSIGGRIAFTGAPYTASKYGVEAFSDVLRRDLYRQGIKVSIIEPAGHQTPILNLERLCDEMRQSYERADKEVRSAYGEEYVEKSSALLKKLYADACPVTDPVIEAYTHAITSLYPRTRYVVGAQAKFLFMPFAYMPDWLSDRLLRMLIKE